MRFFYFHLMCWPYLSEDFNGKDDSAWVPNQLFDPEKGGDLYNEYINSLVYAEEWARHLPDARIVKIKDCAHRLKFEGEEAFVSTVTEFLR